jgi:hypothetical protein
MEFMLQEIESALKAQLYYFAILNSVMIPDVCAALPSADGESDSEKYKAWYNDYVGKTLTWFSDVDCWKLRCGGVHQGRFGHKDMQYDRAVFLLPGPVILEQGRIQSNGKTFYVYSAEEFAKDLLTRLEVGTKRWSKTT